MQNNGLLDVIEELMEAEMTKKDPVKNPQEEKDEVEEDEKLEKAPSEEEVEEDCESDQYEADGVDPQANAAGGKKVAGDPNQEKINKAPVVNEEEGAEEEVDESESPDKEEINKAPVCNEEEGAEEEVEEASEDPDQEEINKAIELKSGSGKVAGKDGKMSVEDTEEEVEKEEVNEFITKEGKHKRVAGGDGRKDVKEEEEVEEASEDPDQGKINKAIEVKSGSGKVAGKDGKMNVEAADVEEDEQETVTEGKQVGIQVTDPKDAILSLKRIGVKAMPNKKFTDEILVDTKDKKKVVKWMTTDGGWDMADIKDIYPELMEAADCDEEEVEEELSAKQKKLDKDGDGKIGADDLKKVRAGEEKEYDEEEVEEELSAKQKKLDKDGDGKIGADDLKKVRAGEEKEYDEEEVEEVEEDLDEDFKTKASIIFETAVNEKVNNKVSALQEEYDTKLNEEIKTINEKVGEYIDYAVQSWLEENKLEIKYSLRTEISENFIKGLKSLFEENYIEIPEEDISVVDELTETVESYKEQLKEQVNELEAARKEILEFHRQDALDGIAEDLTQIQKVKLEKLSESIEAVNIEEFKFKLEQLKEAYFDESGDSPLLTEEILDGFGIEIEEDTEQTVSGDPVNMYAQFLGRTTQK